MTTPQDSNSMPGDTFRQIVQRNLGYVFDAGKAIQGIAEDGIKMETEAEVVALASRTRAALLEVEAGINETTGGAHEQPLLEPLRQFLLALEAGFQELAGDHK